MLGEGFFSRRGKGRRRKKPRSKRGGKVNQKCLLCRTDLVNLLILAGKERKIKEGFVKNCSSALLDSFLLHRHRVPLSTRRFCPHPLPPISLLKPENCSVRFGFGACCVVASITIIVDDFDDDVFDAKTRRRKQHNCSRPLRFLPRRYDELSRHCVISKLRATDTH